MKLLGRRAECEALDQLLTDAMAGLSGTLVLRGEAGAGKSALLAYVSERAEGSRVVRAVGIESEMELAFNGLHQLCAPILDPLDRLPQPQRMALETVFGLPNAPVSGTLDADQEALSASMRAAWKSLAANGDPSTSAVPWPSIADGTSVMSLVPPDPEVETNFFARHHCSFWLAG